MTVRIEIRATQNANAQDPHNENDTIVHTEVGLDSTSSR